MILIRSNAKAKQWNEGEERRFWVKDIRTRGKREAVGQKKVKILASRGCSYGSPKIKMLMKDKK